MVIQVARAKCMNDESLAETRVRVCVSIFNVSKGKEVLCCRFSCMCALIFSENMFRNEFIISLLLLCFCTRGHALKINSDVAQTKITE